MDSAEKFRNDLAKLLKKKETEIWQYLKSNKNNVKNDISSEDYYTIENSLHYLSKMAKKFIDENYEIKLPLSSIS